MTAVALILVAAAVAFAGGWWLRDVLATRPIGSRNAVDIDFVPAAARGELDLDWSDPRPVGGSVRA